MAREASQLWRENSSPRPVLTPASLSTSLPASYSSSSEVIVLSDWWLVKSENDAHGKRLAVRGYLNSGETTMPVFTSAPIAKMLNLYTLETADGSTLKLRGAINEKVMQDNGFPPEVSRCFFMGFPINWYYCAKQYFGNDHMIPRSAALSTNLVNRNEGQFPIHVDGDFPLPQFLVDCAANPESSLDDLLIKTAELHNASVRSETISRPDNDNTDEEICTKHDNLELQAGGTCEHLISSLNVICNNQNESTQRMQIESLSKKGLEFNNEKLDFENTVGSVKFVDEVSNALSPEELNSLLTQQHSKQEYSFANKGPDFRTGKLSSPLEALFESPQAAKINVDTESHPSGAKVNPIIFSPYTRSLLGNMRSKSPCGFKYSAQRIRVNPSNDDSDAQVTSKGSQRIIVDSALYGNTSILSKHGKESNTSDPKNNIKSKEIEGITGKENQTEAMQEAQLNCFEYMKTRYQKEVQRPSISEEGSITSATDANKFTSITVLNPRRFLPGPLELMSIPPKPMWTRNSSLPHKSMRPTPSRTHKYRRRAEIEPAVKTSLCRMNQREPGNVASTYGHVTHVPSKTKVKRKGLHSKQEY